MLRLKWLKSLEAHTAAAAGLSLRLPTEPFQGNQLSHTFGQSARKTTTLGCEAQPIEVVGDCDEVARIKGGFGVMSSRGLGSTGTYRELPAVADTPGCWVLHPPLLPHRVCGFIRQAYDQTRNRKRETPVQFGFEPSNRLGDPLSDRAVGSGTDTTSPCWVLLGHRGY